MIESTIASIKAAKAIPSAPSAPTTKDQPKTAQTKQRSTLQTFRQLIGGSGAAKNTNYISMLKNKGSGFGG